MHALFVKFNVLGPVVDVTPKLKDHPITSGIIAAGVSALGKSDIACIVIRGMEIMQNQGDKQRQKKRRHSSKPTRSRSTAQSPMHSGMSYRCWHQAVWARRE